MVSFRWLLWTSPSRALVLGLSLALLFMFACASTNKPPAPAAPAPTAAPAPAPPTPSAPAPAPAPSASPSPSPAPSATPADGQPLVPGGPPYYASKISQTKAYQIMQQYSQTKLPLWTKAIYGGEERWPFNVTSNIYLDFLHYDNMTRISFAGFLFHFDAGLCSMVGREGHYDTCNGQYGHEDEIVLIPDIITKWEQPDPLTYLLTVRKGVLWPAIPPMNRSDREVTAEDIAWFLNITKQEGVLSYLVALEDGAEAVDRYTVRVKLQAPYAEFIRGLAHPSFGVFAKECYEEKDCLVSKLISPSPFLMAVNEPRKRMVLERNPEYQLKGLPYVDRYTMLEIPDVATQKALFATGQLDACGCATTVSEIMAQQKQVPGERVHLRMHLTAWVGMMVPQLKGPLGDVRVRRALAMTIDQPTAFEVFAEGYGLVGNYVSRDFYGPGYFMTLDQAGEWHQFNPERAKQLLAEAGYPTGFTIGVTTSTASGNFRDLMLFYQSQWKKYLGVDLQIHTLDVATVTSQLYDGSWTDFITANLRGSGWTSADLSIVTMTKGQKLNRQKVDDPVINDLYLKERGELDPAKRVPLLWQFEQRVLDQVYVFQAPYYASGWSFAPWNLNEANHGTWYSMAWLAMADTSRQPKRQ